MKPVMARGSGIVLFSGLFVYLFIARSFACFGLTSYCNKVGRRLASRISEILIRSYDKNYIRLDVVLFLFPDFDSKRCSWRDRLSGSVRSRYRFSDIRLLNHTNYALDDANILFGDAHRLFLQLYFFI